MIFALAAALSWGLADFLGAVSTRRVGLLVTMCIAQLVTIVILGIAGAVLAGEGAHLVWGDLAALGLSGVLGAAAYAGFYRALQLGPVSLVSPLFSAYAVITVLLAVVIGQETLAAAATAGVVLTLGGVVLASAPTRAGTRQRGQQGAAGTRQRGWPPMSGVPLALAAMVSWGVTTYLLGRSAQHLGWFVPVAASRAVTLAILLGAAAAAAALGHRVGRPPLGDLALPGIAGLFDVLAFLAYTRASQGGSLSVAAAASACFPLVVIAGGVLIFGERLGKLQVLGVSLTIAGLFVLGVGR